MKNVLKPHLQGVIIISELRRLRLEKEFQIGLGYMVEIFLLKMEREENKV